MATTITLGKAPSYPAAAQASWQRIILLTVLGYEGAGGLSGGALLIIAPDGRLMQMPVELMHGVFEDFMIPGIILLLLGGLNTFAFISVLRRSTTDWLFASVALGGFVVWFVVEIIVLRELHWLHLMWGLPVLAGWLVLIPLIIARHPTAAMRKILLWCGAFSSIWYFAINVYVPMQYEGYSMSSFTPSELSAIGAPTRQLWVLLALLYPLLFAAFGWGILQSSKYSRRLKVVGALIVAYCAFNLYWPPMHMRGEVTTLTDTLHIVWAGITVLFMMLMMGFGAAALGRRFRIYTIVSMTLHLVFGILTSMQAPNIPTGGPTPSIGIWERLNIAIFMLWVIVLSLALLKKEKKAEAV